MLIFLYLDMRDIAFFIAKNIDIESIKGGSPVVFDRLTTFSSLIPSLYICILNF